MFPRLPRPLMSPRICKAHFTMGNILNTLSQKAGLTLNIRSVVIKSSLVVFWLYIFKWLVGWWGFVRTIGKIYQYDRVLSKVGLKLNLPLQNTWHLQNKYNSSKLIMRCMRWCVSWDRHKMWHDLFCGFIRRRAIWKGWMDWFIILANFFFKEI